MSLTVLFMYLDETFETLLRPSKRVLAFVSSELNPCFAFNQCSRNL